MCLYEGDDERRSAAWRGAARRGAAWRGEWGEGEINVFVLRPPSYAPGERRLACSREKVSRLRRRGSAPRRISAQRYCFCVQRTSVSPLLSSLPPSPSALFSFATPSFLSASRFFEAHICAYIAPSLRVLTRSTWIANSTRATLGFQSEKKNNDRG